MTREQRFGAYSDEDLLDQALGYQALAWAAQTEAERMDRVGRHTEALASVRDANRYLDELSSIEGEMRLRVYEAYGIGGSEGTPGDGGSGPDGPPPLPLSDVLFATSVR